MNASSLKSLLGHYLFLFAMFFSGLILRFIMWIQPGIGWGRLLIYDVELYTEYGKAMIEALLNEDLRQFASINIGVPPLGTFIVGIFASVFENAIGDIYRAGLLAPISFSSACIPLIYLILKKYSRKAAYAASILFIIDPYLIQCSSAYLDAIGVFFLLVTIYVFMSSNGFTIKRIMLIGFSLTLSILTKFTFAIFAAFFILLLIFVDRCYKAAAIIAAFSALSLLFIPWIWFPETFQEAVIHHMSINSFLPPILFGPILIGIPESYPWYFLTYFGLGQVHWKVLPSLSHMLFFVTLIYFSFKRELLLDRKMTIFLLASILSTVFIPRNYWTYSWGVGFARSEEVLFKQFYHYYFYLANISAGAAACGLLFGKPATHKAFHSRSSIIILALYGLTAPYAFIMNAFFPYWSFIFTLILNFSRMNPVMGHHGLIAFIITTFIALTTMVSAMIISRKPFSMK